MDRWDNQITKQKVKLDKRIFYSLLGIYAGVGAGVGYIGLTMMGVC